VTRLGVGLIGQPEDCVGEEVGSVAAGAGV
jgi:hypothetical protein